MNKIATKNIQKTCLFLAVVGALIFAVSRFHSMEPVYNERPLSSWLVEFEKYGTDPDSPPAIAVKSIGIDAIPHLLHALSGQESGFRQKIRDLAEKLSIKISFERTDYMRSVTAAYALNVLGTNAEPAFSALTNVFYEHNTVCSAIALAGIGPEGTQFLLDEIGNRDLRIRNSVVNALGEARSDYEDIVVTLTNILATTKEPILRAAAANSLGRLHQFPESAVPALIPVLSDEDSNVRGMAIISLGQFGSKAKAAVDPLIEALDDPDPVNQDLAKQALEKIALVKAPPLRAVQ